MLFKQITSITYLIQIGVTPKKMHLFRPYDSKHVHKYFLTTRHNNTKIYLFYDSTYTKNRIFPLCCKVLTETLLE